MSKEGSGPGADSADWRLISDGQRYEIRLAGHLDDRWSGWFEAMTLTNAANGEVILSGYLRDQAALHGVLTKIRDLGLPLLGVRLIREPPS